MRSRRKKSKMVLVNAADIASIAKATLYIQRLIEDAQLRDNVRQAIESSRQAYGRLSNGKAPARALLEDTKLHDHIGHALTAARDVTIALTETPKRKARKRRRLGRKLMIVTLGGTLALASSEKLRSKVLDLLFGKEEEFEYVPPPPPTPAPEPTEPVSAA
jgi:hypothetical protein